MYVSQPQGGRGREKGAIPASSIVQAFASLAPSPDDVRVHPAVFGKQKQGKQKGPFVRCIQRKRRADAGGADGEEVVSALDTVNVDSVDKVYRIMMEHMKLDVSCLSSAISSVDAIIMLFRPPHRPPGSMQLRRTSTQKPASA